MIAYGEADYVEAEIESPDELDPFLEGWPVVWVNVVGLADAGLLEELGRRFEIHRLALEDVFNVHQRAKVEPFDHQLFIVARMVHPGGRSETEQVSFFVGAGYVLTFQERPGDSFDLVRARIRSGRGRIRRSPTGYLAYALLDALIDAYFPVLEGYGERLEALESEVMARPEASIVQRMHAVKRELLVMRRAMWPHREAINQLFRDDSSFIDDETRLHLRDCYDHVIQLIDIIETYRELASGLLDAYLSSVSNRMNEIMKILTIFAAIFIPLTFIAGLYGMNFAYMPELQWKWAYPVVLTVMTGVSVVMLLFFRRLGWVGRWRRQERKD